MEETKVDDELARSEYWNARYAKEGVEDKPDALETYDWFRSWEHLEDWFQSTLPSPSTHPKILHLGCGNSTLTADLHRLQYTKQTNIDFSEVVIKAMEAKYEDLGAEWKVMDVRDMELDDNSFDIAIDKATMDSMFHGSMWDPPEDVRDNIEKYIGEVDRILVPGGTFLYITYRQPHFIRPLLIREGSWTVDAQTLPDRMGGVFEYFAYIMKKQGKTPTGANTPSEKSFQ